MFGKDFYITSKMMTRQAIDDFYSTDNWWFLLSTGNRMMTPRDISRENSMTWNHKQSPQERHISTRTCCCLATDSLNALARFLIASISVQRQWNISSVSFIFLTGILQFSVNSIAMFSIPLKDVSNSHKFEQLNKSRKKHNKSKLTISLF